LDIAKLTARLELESSQFKSELEKTNRKLLGFQQQSSRALSSIERQAKAFGRAFTGMFAGLTLAGGIAAIKQAIQFGDEIGKAAVKAGIGAKEMSELAFAARMADVEIGELSNALRFMQVSLSKATTGGKEQLTTLRALGISLEHIKSLDADKQFELIAEQVSRLKDPADRARAVTELLGRAGANLLPMFERGATGIRAAREEAEKTGKSLSNEQVRLLQEGDAAIKQLSASWDGWMARLAVGTVKFAQAVDLIDQTQRLEIFDDLDAARDELATVMRARAFDADRYTKALEKVRTLEAEIFRSGPQRRGRAKGQTSASAPGFEAAAAGPAAIEDAFTPEMRESIRAAERWVTLVNETDKGIAAGIIDTNEAIGDSFNDLQEPILNTTDSMTVFSEQAARNMQDHFANFLFDPFEDGLKGMLKGFVDIIRRMVAEAAAAQIFEKLGGTEGIGSFFSSFFGGASASTGGDALSQMFSLYGGPKAGGGPLQSGKWHMAGEHGPEPIWGGGPGAFAMGYGGGGTTITTNIDARGATQESIKALPEILKRNNEALEARIVQRLRAGKYG
jgi:hypothetical protein